MILNNQRNIPAWFSEIYDKALSHSNSYNTHVSFRCIQGREVIAGGVQFLIVKVNGVLWSLSPKFRYFNGAILKWGKVLCFTSINFNHKPQKQFHSLPCQLPRIEIIADIDIFEVMVRLNVSRDAHGLWSKHKSYIMGEGSILFYIISGIIYAKEFKLWKNIIDHTESMYSVRIYYVNQCFPNKIATE